MNAAISLNSSLGITISKTGHTCELYKNAFYGVLPKNERWDNFHYIKLSQRSFFGRIEDIINCFRDLLTFKQLPQFGPNKVQQLNNFSYENINIALPKRCSPHCAVSGLKGHQHLLKAMPPLKIKSRGNFYHLKCSNFRFLNE